MIRRNYSIVLGSLLVALAAGVGVGCGRSASTLLRFGQLPVNDFPLYLTDSGSGGSNGVIYAYDRDQGRTVFYSGLSTPKGVATDRFKNVYVVEQGLNRVLKIKADTKVVTVLASGLSTPSMVAVDSVGEVYVIQDGAQNIVRLKDMEVMGSGFINPTALAIGVNDLLIVGDSFTNKVYWGSSTSAPSTTVTTPVNISLDQNGRVYVAEGIGTGASVFRFHQEGPGGSSFTVANALTAPSGIAVDPVGNTYIIEKSSTEGVPRLIIWTIEGRLKRFAKAHDLDSPEFMAFTQY